MTDDRTIDLTICVDCLMWIANGDTSGMTDERAAEVMAMSGIDDGWHVAPSCDEECEGWFSWGPCDACQSPLGGERHPAVMWKIGR